MATVKALHLKKPKVTMNLSIGKTARSKKALLSLSYCWEQIKGLNYCLIRDLSKIGG